jgi:hypothetical protein
MEAIAIQTLLTLISGLMTEFGVVPSSAIDKILTALQTLVPILAQGYTALLADVQSVISSLQSQGNLTTAQLATLQTLSTQADTAFDAAATADGAPAPPAS